MSDFIGIDRRVGRNRHQEAQRQATRERIVRAAAEVFEARTYIAATVDDIIATAGVSRAAFYSHFESKLAVLKLFLEDFTVAVTDYYSQLARVDLTSGEALTGWVDGLIELFAKRRSIAFSLNQAALLEPGFFDLLGGRRGDLIQVMVAHVPAFAAAEPVSAGITIHQLDLFAYYAAMGKWDADRGSASRFIAGQLQRFLSDNQPAQKR